MINKSLEANIWKYYVYQFLHLFFLFGAIMTVYFLDLNFSLFQIMIFGSMTWVVSLILEVPSGIIADLYGRKTTLIISSAAYLFFITFLLISEYYLVFLVATIFSGIRLSFKSGSDSALLYDTLKELKREDEHPKITGKVSSLYLVGSAISALIGSYIAKYTSIRYAIFLTLFVAIASLIVTMSFKEPKMHKRTAKKNYFGHLIESLKICMNNNKLKWLIILLSSINALFMIIFGYIQVFLKDYNLDIALFGWVYMGLILFAATSSYFYGSIHKKVSDMNIFRIMAYLSSILVILMFFRNNVIIFIALMLVLELIFGLSRPTKSHFLNKEIESKYRATVLSLAGLLGGLSLAIFQPLTGFIGDIVGIYWLFLIMGISFLVLSMVCIGKLTKHYV